MPGVISTEVGYTQGLKLNPTYEDVCAGASGHVEAVQVTFDTSAVKYEDLLAVFWDIIDPTTVNRQGNDAGTQYRTGIYFHSEAQRTAAERYRHEVQEQYEDVPVVTEILSAKRWYPAEDYHQQYLARGGQCAAKGDTTAIRCYG